MTGPGGDVAESEFPPGWWVLHRVVTRRYVSLSPITADDTDTRHQNGPQWRGV